MPMELDVNQFMFVPSTDVTSIGVGLNSTNHESTGAHNTGLGASSLTVVTTGSSNVGLGYSAGSTITTGSNNLVIGPAVASTTLTTGSNNIIVGTSSAADAATAATSNSLWLGGGATAVMSATAINSTPVVTIPGSLTVTGALTTSGGIVNTAIKSTTAPVTANANTAYANVTGLSTTVVPGTYKFSLVLPSTVASGTGGIKYCFNYTTTSLTSIESTARGYTASAVAVQHTTTTTTQTDLFTQAAVVIFTEIEGTMVVATGGTVDVQVAQNTSNASNTIALLGGTLVFTRIA